MSVLDNPSWHALAGAQRQFGVVGERAGRYRSDISPIAGLADRSAEALEELAGLVEAGTFAAVFAPGEIAGGLRRLWRLAAVVPLSQWICPRPVATVASADELVELGTDDAAAMYRLAKATDPGPFESATHRLGHYVGIRADDQLVAMAGERMRIVVDGDSYREVSAVCTDAGYQGRGYAQALVAEIARRQQAAGALPFLHVRTGSPAEARATRVYAKLGFVKRMDGAMSILVRQ